MQKKWDEITCNYVDDDEFCYIDAWRSGEEQGETVAWVDVLSGRVIYGCPEAMTNTLVQETIKEVVDKAKKEHPYSVKLLEDILKNVVGFECEEIGSGVDVKSNLSSMGFSEEEMVFFGFPEYVE